MGSFNVDRFFTNIPLKESINTCTNLLYNIWLLRNRTSCFAIIFTNKRTVWLWDRPQDLLWSMFSDRFIKLNGSNSALVDSNQFFTEDMLMMLLFYLNQVNISQNSRHVLIHVILIYLFHLSKKKSQVAICRRRIILTAM